VVFADLPTRNLHSSFPCVLHVPLIFFLI
jgi:hypothetical protein